MHPATFGNGIMVMGIPLTTLNLMIVKTMHMELTKWLGMVVKLQSNWGNFNHVVWLMIWLVQLCHIWGNCMKIPQNQGRVKRGVRTVISAMY